MIKTRANPWVTMKSHGLVLRGYEIAELVETLDPGQNFLGFMNYSTDPNARAVWPKQTGFVIKILLNQFLSW